MSDPSGISIGTQPTDLFAGGGEMGALMRATDWSQTRLGPVENWPQSLRTMLGVVLGSRFPMLLWWGPDLLHLYNDAYRPILRDKHPASLAAPAAEVWSEVWDVAGPMARGVQEGGPATWTEDLQLFINSGGMAEETYFTFSYSPVPGDDGRVGGLLNTVQETTTKVQSERQIHMLHDLVARAAEAKSERDAYRIAGEVLAANQLDLPFVLLYALGDGADHAQLVAGWSEYEGPAKPERVLLGEIASWPFAEVVRTAREVMVDDLALRFETLPEGRWNASPERAIVLPLARAAQSTPYGFLVAGLSPHRAFDERYARFFRVTAHQVANVIDNARAYEMEKQRAETLVELDRAKTIFFNNVSHEFRTPLTLILSPVEDALAQSRKALEGENLEAVHRSAQRLLRLVNSLLDFARIEAGRMETRFVATDLSVLTAELASSFRSLIEGAGLRFVVDCPPLPERVHVDVAQWERIVLNLLSNAFKFTLAGEITVRLRHRQDHVELEVRDTGCGIPEREIPHMFERFHRIEGSPGRSFEGTGIGLSLVHEFAKLHGGAVRVTSVEGKGSTFLVSLPTGTAHLPAEPVGSEPRERSSASSGAPYLLEAMGWAGRSQNEAALLDGPAGGVAPRGRAKETSARVLIADDNAEMRGYLTRILGAHWNVEVTHDGEAALEAARAHPPDLIVSDVMMPRLDGYGLLRELRGDPRTRMVPFLLLSARAGEEAVLEGLETGADDYLVKPFSARELLARVRTHLQMAAMRRQAVETARELAETRRTLLADVERKNRDLESFSYSISHDLRAPLRVIDGFIGIVLEECADRLDERASSHLRRVSAAAVRMGHMIDALLELSRTERSELRRQRVDLSRLAREVADELQRNEPGRNVDVRIEPGLEAEVDVRLLRIALENLMGNAWKFTARVAAPVVECGALEAEGIRTYFVRDNGVGFDAGETNMLFQPFQRLHSAAEAPGTGIGLATVRRIIERHGGHVSAEGAVGKGATIYFTLPS